MNIPIIYNELGKISSSEISKYIDSKSSSISHGLKYNLENSDKKIIKNTLHSNSESKRLSHRKKRLGRIVMRDWYFANHF